ncbi:MAG: Re/Si-specific NAD(P)(+) transhydrogenase subunit alpha [Gemmatimonadales bacterium]
MIVGVPKETAAGERRVALTPDVAKRLGLTVRVERGAGVAAGFPDQMYAEAGCELSDRAAAFNVDVVTCVQIPGTDAPLKPGSVVIGTFMALARPEEVRALAGRGVTVFSLDLLPRITRAQSMDVLSSMSTVAGYKAVLLAAAAQGRFFPMLVTAAGTLPPARALILGAGVAGLQAIATARRLGAVVEAFDVRAAAKEQVESLGAKFIAADVGDLTAEGRGGYAKELSEDQHRRELELLHKHAKDADIIIATALIPGKPAPVLITAAMVRDMKPGAVIVDLAAEMGGNCELTKPGEDIVVHGVTILGPRNLPATMPQHASQMYAKNMSTFLGLCVKQGAWAPDANDEIIKATLIRSGGA